MLRSGVSLTGDISHIHSAQLDVCADIVPLFRDGQIVGALALMKNMTELVQTNQELEHFKRLSAHLQNELSRKDDLPPAFRKVYGHSRALVEELRMAARAATSEASICIMGESGVGKEVVAEAIHASSGRAGGPLVKINCAAIPENLLRASCSDTKPARSPVPGRGASRASLSWPRAVHSFWTRSARCP